MAELRLGRAGTRLFVRGKAWLALAGELGNSSASRPGDFAEIFPVLAAMGLNTVLVPVYWELVEPVEGRFDLSLLRVAVDAARGSNLKIVPLWFGLWKNSMSCYAPGWMKSDPVRFPRAVTRGGARQEIVSAFCEDALTAEERAFRALASGIKSANDRDETVIMLQVENEVGLLGDSRERGAEAEKAFAGPVPRALMEYLSANASTLRPGLRGMMEAAGSRVGGTWSEVFGAGAGADEIFMAWGYARHAERLAAAGKEICPLPMFVNAALNAPGKAPGEYPAAGPLPHVFDIWKAAAPSIDMLCPDIYFPDFGVWASRYATPTNPLFIPEARFGADSAAHAFFAVGALGAIGYSPFDIGSGKADSPLARAYEVLGGLTGMILERQGSPEIAGALVTREEPQSDLSMGGYTMRVSHDFAWEWSGGDRSAPVWPGAACLVLRLAEDEFIIAGTGVIVTFALPEGPGTGNAGILSMEEGRLDGGEWRTFRRLNGDQTHQGRHARIPSGECGTLKVRLYRF